MSVNKVYNRIESITGNVITVRANDVKYRRPAALRLDFGVHSLAIVSGSITT